jgi:hypothetical protein
MLRAIRTGEDYVLGDGQRSGHEHITPAVNDNSILVDCTEHQRMIGSCTDERAGTGRLQENVHAAILRDRNSGIRAVTRYHCVHPTADDGTGAGPDVKQILRIRSTDPNLSGRIYMYNLLRIRANYKWL